MKCLRILATAVIALAASAAIALTVVNNSATSDIAIVPYPNEIELGSGTFDAKGADVTYDVALDEATVNVIKTFAERLSFVSGAENAVSAGNSDKGFVFVYNASLPSEAYNLEVKKDVVCVEASALRGFNYAVQTLKQLLPVGIFSNEVSPKTKWSIPVVKISDEPRFAYRGMHFDVSRHFYTVEQVKRYLAHLRNSRVRVRHTANNAVALFLKLKSAVEHVTDSLNRTVVSVRSVERSVNRYLVSLVKKILVHFFLGKIEFAEFLAIHIESRLHSVSIKQLRQTLVLNDTVIIAERQRLRLATRKSQKNRTHNCLLIINYH